MTPNAEPERPAPPPLSKSSRFNIKLMWNINRLSIAIFVAGVIYVLLRNWLR